MRLKEGKFLISVKSKKVAFLICKSEQGSFAKR
jgi:hypothetical protein